MNYKALSLFTLQADQRFGAQVAEALGVDLAPHEERDFEDGEHKIRPLASVRGHDVYIVQSLYSGETASVNEKLCRLLFFIGALKDAAAARINVIVPYLCYARKDRQTKTRDPVTTRYIAALFEAVGSDCVLTLDVHNLAAFQNAFRCRTEHLEAGPLFVDWLAGRVRKRDVVVVSPDAGGVKRANRFKDALCRALGCEDLPTAFMEKIRSEDTLSGRALVGEVRGKTAIIIDDMIASGGTLARAAKACREQGAQAVYAAATHGLFVGDANEVLADEALDAILITDSVPPLRLSGELLATKVTVLPTAPLFADAIRRMHVDESVTALNEDGL